MDARTKELLNECWNNAIAFGSHGTYISFEDWFQERFSKETENSETKSKRKQEDQIFS